jgi:hypothetical protein
MEVANCFGVLSEGERLEWLIDNFALGPIKIVLMDTRNGSYGMSNGRLD